MIRGLILIVLVSFALHTEAAPAEVAPFEIAADQVAYVYDGDTFFIKCQKDLQCDGWKIGIRPPNVDTPEIKARCEAERELAWRAKEFTVELLRGARRITLKPLKNRPYDKFGRLLAEVDIDGSDLGESLIRAGLARPYGNGRKSWCD
jgi:micrococcal nuclease